MEIEAATRTILEKSPGLRAKDLLLKVKHWTGKSRSTIFQEWESLVLRGELYRKKGRYWNEKPREAQEKTGLLKSISDHLDRRSKRKRREKKENEKQIDLEIRRRDCRCRIREMKREYCRTRPYGEGNDPVPLEIVAEIEKKCREQFGLSATDPL